MWDIRVPHHTQETSGNRLLYGMPKMQEEVKETEEEEEDQEEGHRN